MIRKRNTNRKTDRQTDKRTSRIKDPGSKGQKYRNKINGRQTA